MLVIEWQPFLQLVTLPFIVPAEVGVLALHNNIRIEIIKVTKIRIEIIKVLSGLAGNPHLGSFSQFVFFWE